jgi:5-methylcytosine-specific restriction endonuclease McrA
MADHRRPPPFPYRGPLRIAQCCFCGDPILPASTKPGHALGHHERRFPQRSRWHLECLEIYLIATSSKAASRAVFKRDHGICRQCGTDTATYYEIDHIVPLWRAPRDWWFWGLDNLRLLCLPCHKDVTAEQARERAALRRTAGGRQLSFLAATVAM